MPVSQGLHGLHDNKNARRQNQRGLHHAGQGFKFAVPIRVLLIRRGIGGANSPKRNHRRQQIGCRVRGLRQYRNRADGKADRKFGKHQKNASGNRPAGAASFSRPIAVDGEVLGAGHGFITFGEMITRSPRRVKRSPLPFPATRPASR